MRITKRTLVPLRQSRGLMAHRPDRAWAVCYPEPGADGSSKLGRRYFRSRMEAEAFCIQKRSELFSLGVEANNLTDDIKRQVLSCLQMLQPTGRSLTEAVSWFVKQHKAAEDSVTVKLATQSLIHRATADGQSQRHVQGISSVMSIFGRAYGDKLVTEIKGDDIQAWLDAYRTKDGRPLSSVSFNSYRRYLGLFFAFCVRRGWVRTNPSALVTVRKVMSKAPRLLSPQDLRAILAGTPSELKPAVAIQAFCGLRVAEMARLRWSDVLITPEGGYIQVGADNAKTSRRRLTPIPAQLISWICKQRKADGFVYEAGKGSVDSLHRAEIALRESLASVEWGRNALRVSALSYRLAQTKDAAATALEMGNSATVLLRDYRELTTPAKAAEWFGVEL